VFAGQRKKVTPDRTVESVLLNGSCQPVMNGLTRPAVNIPSFLIVFCVRCEPSARMAVSRSTRGVAVQHVLSPAVAAGVGLNRPPR
jgi:hypothetical protein